MRKCRQPWGCSTGSSGACATKYSRVLIVTTLAQSSRSKSRLQSISCTTLSTNASLAGKIRRQFQLSLYAVIYVCTDIDNLVTSSQLTVRLISVSSTRLLECLRCVVKVYIVWCTSCFLKLSSLCIF